MHDSHDSQYYQRLLAFFAAQLKAILDAAQGEFDSSDIETAIESETAHSLYSLARDIRNSADPAAPTLPENAVALRPVQIDRKANAFILYTPITFDTDAYFNCLMEVRRLHAISRLNIAPGAKCVLDVLDKNGDIIGDFWLTADGLEDLVFVYKLSVSADG